MRITRLFHPGHLQPATIITLNGPAHHYLVNVLRCELSQPLILFNGDGYDYYSRINNLSKKKITIKIIHQEKNSLESPLQITLGQSLLRQDKMDYVMQKSVELGVKHISPILTERVDTRMNSERLKKRLNHWESIINHACEQSGRACIPHLNPPQLLRSFLSESAPTIKPSTIKLIATPNSNYSFKNIENSMLNKTIDTLTILLGPPGGFTDDEIALAKKENFIPVSLGPRILRAETASITALSLCQLLWGDMT